MGLTKYYTATREPSKYWDKKLQEIHRGLYHVWWESEHGGCWAIRYKDERTGLDRLVMHVSGDKLEAVDLNDSILQGVRTTVDWSKVDQYPDPEEMFKAIRKEYDDFKRRERMREQGMIFDYNRENLKKWKKALEIARQDPRVAASIKKALKKQWDNRKINNVGRGY